MGQSSPDLPLKELVYSGEEKPEVQASVTVLEIQLSKDSTRDLEEGRTSSDNAEDDLPRADGGKDAWLFLAACFVFEALIWGK